MVILGNSALIRKKTGSSGPDPVGFPEMDLPEAKGSQGTRKYFFSAVG